MRKVYIVSTARTAIGSFGGGLQNTPATDLASVAVKAAMERGNIAPEMVDELILGNVLSAGQGMGPGRQAAIKAGLPNGVPGYTLNMLCGSGMKAVMSAADRVRLGDTELSVAAGAENMSQAPFMLSWKNRFGQKLGDQQVQDLMLLDGLTDVFNSYHMGVTAENIARKHTISRQAQDEFALLSQKRAHAAVESGKFKDEITPVSVKSRKGVQLVSVDEHPRPDSTLVSLSKLRPAFEKEGTVTAGNASGINDGGAALIVASEEAVKKFHLSPIAELISYDQAAVDPAYMGLGPVPATQRALKKVGMDLRDMELIELNEAFAAQSLGVLTELADFYGESADSIIERTNVNGGAIALGHPLGASGARILTTLLYELRRRNLTLGLATLCIGGGMGTACVVKIV